MTNSQNILDIVVWLEANLDKDLSISDIARKSGYSLFYFSRLFKSVTGILPKDYILRRKLSEAGRELTATRSRVSDIALKWGFSGSDSFSRAFRREFGTTPSLVRLGKGFSYFPPARPTFRDAVIPEVRTVWIERKIIAGKMIRVSDPSCSLHEEWESFKRDLKAIPNRKQPENYIQLAAWEDESTDWVDIMVGVEIESIEDLPVNYAVKLIPKSLYLAYTHHGPITTIRESYERIYMDILPGYNGKPNRNFCFETMYSAIEDPLSPDYSFTIFIPVQD